MNNPFETGHIKSYVLFYLSVVVIVVLFFIAATLFLDPKVIDKKIFAKDKVAGSSTQVVHDSDIKEEEKPRFRLLKKRY